MSLPLQIYPQQLGLIHLTIRVKIPRDNIYSENGLEVCKNCLYLLTRSIVAGLISNDSFCEATVSLFMTCDEFLDEKITPFQALSRYLYGGSLGSNALPFLFIGRYIIC